MPTNEERREVAARLRSLKFTFEDDLEDELSAFYDALECNPRQKRWETNPYWFLADLIEPEPERTCRNVFPKDGILPNHPETMFRCSECGCDVQDCESYAISMVGGSWNFCPNCGLKVVE